MKQLLKLENVNVSYVNKEKEVHAVRNVTFEINKGDSLGIVGESGSGKSTLAMALLRLHDPASTKVTGKALFEESDLLSVTQEEMNKLRWSEISVVFQKAMNALSPVHRIHEQVEDIYHVHDPKASKKEIEQRMLHLLKLVNLPERVYRLYPHEMSGGMLQRVAIAVSLLHSPKLIIFDEATTALDVVTQGQILKEVVQMESEIHMTRIMITHDMSVVAASCNKVAVMYAGEMMEVGLVKDIFKNPLHPYTQGLLKSFPSLKGENSQLLAIPGFLPDLSKEVCGCIFAPRCPHATAKCQNQKPEQMSMENGHMTACWLYQGGASDEQ